MMPGTIHVSVLEIIDLQPPSPLSQVSIKVSIGKNEYQTRVNKELTFPLVSLRDNLIIKTLDAGGNEISQTDVETRLIVEKGLWNDIFPLRGGGQVRMKFQFVLSEEERDQVRAMRETALRKKHGELKNANLGNSDSATDVSSSAASTSQFKDEEASDSQKSLLRSEAAARDSSSGIKDTEGTQTVPKQANTKSKDMFKETFISSASVEKFKTPKPATDVTTRTALGSSESLVAPQHDLASSKLNEKPSPLNIRSSKVKNMISVFESGQVEDAKPRVRSPSAKPIASPRPMKSEMPAQDTQTTATTANLKHKSSVKHEEIHSKVVNTSGEDSDRAFASQTATASGRMLDENSTKEKLADEQPYGGNIVTEEQGHHPKDLHEVNTQGALPGTLRPEECWEDCYDCLDFSGSWMFRDNTKRLCLTTAGKQLMHVMGDCCAEAKTDLVNISSATPEKVQQENKQEQPSPKPIKSKSGSSTDGEPRRGPIGQVVRVAIIVGFAALVFFTRERRFR